MIYTFGITLIFNVRTYRWEVGLRFGRSTLWLCRLLCSECWEKDPQGNEDMGKVSEKRI